MIEQYSPMTIEAAQRAAGIAMKVAELAEYLTGITPWEKTRVSKCVIPSHLWDGDTGISDILARKNDFECNINKRHK